MKRIIVISVLLAAGFLFHESAHMGRPSGVPAVPPAAPPAESARLPATGACRVLMDYFKRLEDPPAAASPCVLAAGQAEAIVAMAPHPVNSGLALTFDREIESIQRAAAGAGYEYHQHYFPWTTAGAAAAGGESGEPGLLLFRGPAGSKPLVVLVLPETPAGYLDPPAFQAAASYARQLDKSSDTIRILGPSTSGTVPALRKLIDEWRANAKENRQAVEFDIVSGAATARAALAELTRGAPYISFHAMLYDDEAALTAFKNYFGWNARMVLLSESGTAYGRQRLRIPSISFPREMSRLRNASGQLPGAAAPADARAPALRLLPLDLRDSSASQDIVRTFSGTQLAASQEAVLLSIADQLRRERVQYAGILATDVLDGIFLAKFVGDSCPNVRLFTLDPDLLFARAAEELPFNGVVALGTYPLYAREEPMRESAPQAVLHFPSQQAAATYDALRALLNRAGRCCAAAGGPLFRGHLQAGTAFQAALERDRTRRRLSFRLPEPFHPQGTDQWMVSVEFKNVPAPWTNLNGEWAASLVGDDRVEIEFNSRGIASEPPRTAAALRVAPLWISVLSRRGYWPVASVGPAGFPALAEPAVIGAIEQPSGAWKFLFLAVSLAAILFAAAVFGAPPLPAYLAAGAGQGRAWYLLIATLALGFVYATLVAPLAMTGADVSSAPGIAGAVIFAAATLSLAGAAARLLQHAAFARGGPRVVLFGAGSLAVFATAVFYMLKLVSLPDTHRAKTFAAYRTFDPLSGVSPAIPLALVALAIFWWAVVHAKRLWMASFRVSGALPPIETEGRLEPLRQAVEEAIEQPFFQGRRVAAAILIFFLTVGLRGRMFDSFEPPSFADAYAALAAIAAAILFLTWTRFLLIWVRFAAFLEELARHPIRSALENLPRTHSWSAIFQSPALLDPARWDDLARETWMRLNSCAMAAAADAGSSAAPPDPKEDRMQKCVGIVRGEWNRGRSESWSRALAARAKHLVVNTLDRSDERTVVAGEFVAQPFHRFVIYVLLHMRNLVFFISIGFALVTLSLFSFPFQAHYFLSAVAVGVLLVLGASLAYVFAQVDKDAVLSWMNDTTPGELGSAFYLKVLSYGAIPLATLLSTQFPSIGRTLLDWVQPFSQALK